MAVQVEMLVGPPRCGKSQHLLQTYRDALAQTRQFEVGKLCWLGPNQTAIAHLREALATDASGGLLSPALYTFAGFAESLIQRSPRRIRAISAIQKRRLLRHLSRQASHNGELKHFGRVAGTPGFVNQLDETIAELKRTDTWSEKYLEWSESRPRGDLRSREIAKLYAAYQSQLHRADLYDSEGRFWAAREILAALPVSAESKYRLIVVSGFNDFTSAQFDILRLLAERSERMIFSLTCEGNSANGLESSESTLFAKTAQTMARLRELFPKVLIRQLSHEPAPVNSLAEFQQTVLRESAIADGNGRGQFAGVEIIAATSELGEVETIAHAIKKLLSSGKVAPEEIALVHRGGEEAATRISAVFPEFGIPFHSDQRPRLETEPLVRTLLALLRLELEDWPFQTLREVIGNHLIKRFDGGMADTFEQQPRVALETCLRWAQLPAGKRPLLEQLHYRVEHASKSDEGLTDGRTIQLSSGLDLLQLLDQVLSAQPSDGTLAEWEAAIEHLLFQLGVISADEPTHSREMSAWRHLQRGLRECQRVDSWSRMTESLTLGDAQELIETISREQSLPSTNDSVGRVQVLSAEAARKLSVDHLFVAGLNEQAFTSVSANSRDVSPAKEVGDADGSDDPNAFVDRSVARNDAQLLFYELVTRPTKSLTLSYSALDAKGQPLPASPLLAELKERIGEDRIAQRTLALGQLSDSSSAPLSVGDFRRAAVTKALEGEHKMLAGMISQPRYVRAGSSILNGIECVAQRASRDEFTAYEGLIHSEAARSALAARFNAEHLWSPSRLEGYATCPFRFFGEQLLKLQPLNELTLRNDARRRGSLLHQVLATIHEQLRQESSIRDQGSGASPDDPPDPDGDELIRRFLEALDAEVKAKPLWGMEQSLREIERREIEAWVPSYAEQEREYRQLWQHFDEPPRPAHFEVRFGPEARGSRDEASDRASTELPFQLELGNERIMLTGQIDRVDLGRVGGVTVFNIIDYKSGKEVRLKHDRVRSGHQLQLPLYALAAEQLLLADQEAVAFATGYWNIRGRGFQTKNGGSLQLREEKDQTVQDAPAWADLQPDILDRIQQLISGIRHGDFPVHNEDQHCTRSCELSTICRIAQIRSLEKPWPPAENDC